MSAWRSALPLALLVAWLPLAARADSACPGSCSGRGTCNELLRECSCISGFCGADCSRNLLPACSLGEEGRPFTAEGMHLYSVTVTFPGPLPDPDPQSEAAEFAETGLVRTVEIVGPLTCACAQQLGRFWAGRSGHAWLCYDVDDPTLDGAFAQPTAARYRNRIRAVLMQEGYPVVDLPDHALPRGGTHVTSVSVALGEIRDMSLCTEVRVTANSCGHEGFCRRHNDNTPPFCHCPGGCSEGEWLLRSCPNQCNFRGSCYKGLCLCEKGYWGIDCAVRWEGSGDSRRAVVDVNYDISRYSLVPKGVRGAAGADAGDAERDAFDPRSPTFYVVDQPPQFRSQPNFWEHGDWWPYVLSDPRRVGDPREANYFFFTQSMYMPVDALLANLFWLRDYWPPYRQSMSGNTLPRHFGMGVLDHGLTDYHPNMWHVGFRGFPDDFNPASEKRHFFYLQHHLGTMGPSSGVCWSCFQEGKDIGIPPSHASLNGPMHGYSYQDLQAKSPWSPDNANKGDVNGADRPTLLYWAGLVPGGMNMDRIADMQASDLTGRYPLIHYHRNTTGFKVAVRMGGANDPNSLPMPEEMSKAKFCYVPFGFTLGYGARYLNAVLFGCIPVYWVDGTVWGRTYPFNEHPDIDWHRCSVTVTREGMPGLKETLEAMVADGRYADMVACLRETRVWERLLYTNFVKKGGILQSGSYLGETGNEDAWETLWNILALRLARQGNERRKWEGWAGADGGSNGSILGGWWWDMETAGGSAAPEQGGTPGVETDVETGVETGTATGTEIGSSTGAEGTPTGTNSGTDTGGSEAVTPDSGGGAAVGVETPVADGGTEAAVGPAGTSPGGGGEEGGSATGVGDREGGGDGGGNGSGNGGGNGGRDGSGERARGGGGDGELSAYEAAAGHAMGVSLQGTGWGWDTKDLLIVGLSGVVVGMTVAMGMGRFAQARGRGMGMGDGGQVAVGGAIRGPVDP